MTTDAHGHPAIQPSGHAASRGRTVLLIASDRMGEGSEELGRVLIRSFLKTVKDLQPPPWRAIFVNAGVHLTTDGSPLLEDLQALESAGVEILSCGTCLDYFHKKDQVRSGRASNMTEIVQSLAVAERILRP